jgi:hypothetical protein
VIYILCGIGRVWRRALTIVGKEQKDWVAEDGIRREIGLSIMYFDAVHPEDEVRKWLEVPLWSVEEGFLVRELRHELNLRVNDAAKVIIMYMYQSWSSLFTYVSC